MLEPGNTRDSLGLFLPECRVNKMLSSFCMIWHMVDAVGGCRVWFFLSFKEQILGIITASTVGQAPDEVCPQSQAPLFIQFTHVIWLLCP